jgi:hypothetical protein
MNNITLRTNHFIHPTCQLNTVMAYIHEVQTMNSRKNRSIQFFVSNATKDYLNYWEIK